MRLRLFLMAFLLPCALWAEGPKFQHKDTATQQEFESVYQDLRTILTITGSSKCIDSPTLCIDFINHWVMVNSTSSTAPGLQLTGKLVINGARPQQAINLLNNAFIGGNSTVGTMVRIIGRDTGNVISIDPDGQDTTVGSNFYSSTDSVKSLGTSAHRWSAVWAQNGTIQTSDSSTKRNIVDLDTTTLTVPKGVTYTRPNSTQVYMGFLADGLPDAAYAVIGTTGTIDRTNIYTSSVIGILCAKVRQLDNDLRILRQALGR